MNYVSSLMIRKKHLKRLLITCLLIALSANVCADELEVKEEYDRFRDSVSLKLGPHDLQGYQRAAIRGEQPWLAISLGADESMMAVGQVLIVFHSRHHSFRLGFDPSLYFILDDERMTIESDSYTREREQEIASFIIGINSLNRLVKDDSVEARLGQSVEFELSGHFLAALKSFIKRYKEIRSESGR